MNAGSLLKQKKSKKISFLLEAAERNAILLTG
jgi:hypothetical protein